MAWLLRRWLRSILGFLKRVDALCTGGRDMFHVPSRDDEASFERRGGDQSVDDRNGIDCTEASPAIGDG